MSKKTCGECRYMLHKDTFEVCTHSMTETSMFGKACKHFSPPTNGDKIRAMSNDEFVNAVNMLCIKFTIGNEFVAWLDAPVESEGKDE